MSRRQKRMDRSSNPGHLYRQDIIVCKNMDLLMTYLIVENYEIRKLDFFRQSFIENI